MHNLELHGRRLRVGSLRDISQRKKLEERLKQEIGSQKTKTMQLAKSSVRIGQLLDKIRRTPPLITDLLDAAPFDPYDLPGYAGALFDFYRSNPGLIRLARWRGLERPDAEPLPVAQESTRAKLRALAEAQAEGAIDAGLPPHALLTLVLSLSATWSEGSPEAAGPGDDPELVSIRRHAVVVAVGRLTRPPAARLTA